MRIVLSSAISLPHVGGIERFTETLAAGLAERGHEVTVICSRYLDAPRQEQTDGYAIRRIPSSYLLERRLGVPYPVPAPRALVSQVRQSIRAADLVHVQDALYATSVAALITASRHRVPSVLTQHGLRSAGLASALLRPRRARGSRHPGGEAHASRRGWRPITRRSPSGSRVAGAFTTLACFPSASCQAAGGDRATLRRSFGLAEDRFVALFVGRDVHKKGLDVFLEGADPAYDLVAVTDRPETTASATMPFMSHQRLGELLQCVDAFVLPSVGEGFPLSLQEALAAGLPGAWAGQSRRYDRAHVRADGSSRTVRRRAVRPEAVRAALAPPRGRRYAVTRSTAEARNTDPGHACRAGHLLQPAAAHERQPRLSGSTFGRGVSSTTRRRLAGGVAPIRPDVG